MRSIREFLRTIGPKTVFALIDFMRDVMVVGILMLFAMILSTCDPEISTLTAFNYIVSIVLVLKVLDIDHRLKSG